NTECLSDWSSDVCSSDLRVAREAATDLVVHTAPGHRGQRLADDLALPAAQQELQRRGLRELRGAAEAAPLRVEGPAQAHDSLVQDRKSDVSGRLYTHGSR